MFFSTKKIIINKYTNKKKEQKKNHNYQNNGYLGNFSLKRKTDLIFNFLNLSQVLELEVRAFF